MAYLFEDKGSFVYHVNDGTGGKTWNNHTVKQGEFNTKIKAAVTSIHNEIDSLRSYIDTTKQSLSHNNKYETKLNDICFSLNSEKETKEKQIKKVNQTLKQLQQENQSLREELALVKKSLVDILEVLVTHKTGTNFKETV